MGGERGGELWTHRFGSGWRGQTHPAVGDIFGDRQFHARRNLVAIDDEDLQETVIVPSVLPRLSKTPGRIKHLGPRLGQHTNEVLRELVGLSDEEIADLRARRII